MKSCWLKQQRIFDIIKTHSGHGGLSVITGDPGVGKSVLKESIEAMERDRDTVIVSCSRTMHTYLNILKQLAHSLDVEFSLKNIEKDLIEVAYRHVRDRKTIYTLIDEAHLIDMTVLRKLRLLFDQFPKKHNIVLLGQTELMFYLSMKVNEDLKSRITFSECILPLLHRLYQFYISLRSISQLQFSCLFLQ